MRQTVGTRGAQVIFSSWSSCRKPSGENRSEKKIRPPMQVKGSTVCIQAAKDGAITTMVLSPDSEFFKYFDSATGAARRPAAR